MATQHHSPHVVRFGVFEVDLQARELRKRGLKIKIHEQPFQILSVLLERAGEVVTRDELRQRIWPADTFVDFDHSLSTGVNKLREALGDSADNPRFVETVPRRGYRFLGSVEQIGKATLGVKAGLPHQQEATATAVVHPGHVLRWYSINWRLAGVALLIMLIGGAVWFRFAHPFSRPPTPPMTILPLTGYGLEGAPAFSPDGNQVAFSWSGPNQDNEDVYVKLIGTENLLRLTNSPASDWNPAWSPDGRFIVFLRRLENEKHSVIMIPALGGPERTLAEISLTGSELSTHLLNWSPDSKHLIIVDRRVREEPTGLFVFSLETGEKHSLISPPAKSIGDSDPAFSPDGRALAFLRSPSHTVYDLYVLALSEDLRPQGEPRRLTFDNGWIYGAAWTPDGHEIVFSSDRLNAPRLWRIVASGLAQPQPLALVGDDVFAPAISRQGQRLAYAHATGDREIWQVRVPDLGDKASPPSKFIPSLFDHFSPQYSPDGKKVAFTSRRSGSCEIWVCEADGSNAMQLTSLGGPRTERASWSPDGKKIAFQSLTEGQAEIYVINSEGGRPKRLTYEQADDVAPSWSHDGTWIYFGSHRTGIDQVWKMPAEGGTPVQVTKNGGIAAVESPDGKFLYYTKVRGITGLWRMPVESGPETQVLESLLYLNFAVRPEGIHFSPATGPSSIWPSFQILSFPSGKVKTIVQGATLGLEVRTMTVAPNGRSILYSRPGPEHSNLMLVENFR